MLPSRPRRQSGERAGLLSGPRQPAKERVVLLSEPPRPLSGPPRPQGRVKGRMVVFACSYAMLAAGYLV